MRGERELEAPDADAEAEEAPPLEAPLEQALELLVVLADSRRFRPLLAPGLPQLLHLTIGAPQQHKLKLAESPFNIFHERHASSKYRYPTATGQDAESGPCLRLACRSCCT